MSLIPQVVIAGAGPGDPDQLTIAVIKALAAAEVVLHDRLVPAEILALATPQAQVIETGKEGFGPAMAQEEISALMVALAREGKRVLRLKAGDPGVFGRLDEEIEALEAAGIGYRILPGITAATAAVARIGQSFTRRGRNTAALLLSAHDTRGFAEADWRALARPGAVAAIYMGKRAARFVQGRLMMHGAAPETDVTVLENVSRGSERVIGTTLAELPATVADLAGPAVILLGLAPRAARPALAQRAPAPALSAPHRSAAPVTAAPLTAEIREGRA
ncbi:uroporphyrinogen-III C-methyltransferase [Phaeovulum vinaykumarii]|uniref:uroporphyrinogen-III C-methyltransferase n=1 Tax=Phaeovulum vinaykumarii TaxID=407234 RepID=A0A1N7LMB5_9RHOB|nr:uroporphyrinogen-III C-methyltransferase [Phaeovulum vinaykumarii]SIS74957.1 uroporphyrinogen-III C-methyltransferase [Phaeovulum vinaykumarii]SOC05385.1 uroporphyrinogen-III C-methyltransferase [Phaeovulum vinaykumarii]